MVIESLINDVNIIKRFYEEVYEDLKLNEIHFISLAARNKYLTEEERSIYRLGNTQMLNKTIVRTYNFQKFISKVQQIFIQIFTLH